MAEKDFADKTEAPTPKRRKEAQKEGKVPRTPELSAAAMLLAAGFAFGPAAGWIGGMFESITRVSLASGPGALSDPTATVEWFRWVTMQAAIGFLPFAGALMGVGLLVGAGQGRGTLTTKPLQPNWGRLSPPKNLKRFMSPRPLVDLLKALFKVGVVGTVVYFVLAGATDDLTQLPQSSPWVLVQVLQTEVVRVLLSAGLALLFLSVLDYGYQSWEHLKELRMSKDEVKRELKDTEGDPLIRARLRSLGRSLARHRMMEAIPTADVVVTNPTHIAVALKYDPEKADAPVVVAMGQRKVAQRIREIALHHQVPLVENKPVARALFAAGKVGLPIPPALYIAVAEILAFVFRHRRAREGSIGVTA